MLGDGVDRIHATALAAAVDAVLSRLADPSDPVDPVDHDSATATAEEVREPPDTGSASALDALCACFGLSSFERDLLVLCAAIEVDPTAAARCAAVSGDPAIAYPTFRMALARLRDPHWSALTPQAPLRRFRLLELDGDGVLLTARLRIDERVLHFLTGVPYLDRRLAGLLTRCPVPDLPFRLGLPPSHARVADELAAALTDSPAFVDLTGEDTTTRRELAAAAAAECGLALYAVRAAELPGDPTDRDQLARLWEREAVLLPAALLIELDAGPTRPEIGVAEVFGAALEVPVVLSGLDPHVAEHGSAVALHRPRLTVPSLPQDEQRELWRYALNGAGGTIEPVELGRLVAQFSLPGHVIRSAGGRARTADAAAGGTTGAAEAAGSALATAAWQAGLDHARVVLDELGRRVEPRSAWDDLVLPQTQLEILRQVVAHVRQRALVYNDWGFERVLQRGLGITALFAGPSGTGKTLAAEVVAAELGLDMFIIDLSQVVSKYIGETEKNLRRVFDAAERGGAVLVFDEADALFGKRSEVKDSHDRYANLEVSYLLMRMETYRGLAVLTTNAKKALDAAFLRRLRFVVDFPFPGAGERVEIWRRLIPAMVPSERLDLEKLAKLTIAGGNIRNIALGAAFLAADEATPLSMRHLRSAARAEYTKNERNLSSSEVASWS